jgi:hypothetical protein
MGAEQRVREEPQKIYTRCVNQYDIVDMKRQAVRRMRRFVLSTNRKKVRGERGIRNSKTGRRGGCPKTM